MTPTTTTTTLDWHPCACCGDDVPAERWHLGYHFCMPCGEQQAREARAHWCVAPMHKSNYVLITSPELLHGLNNKQQR